MEAVEAWTLDGDPEVEAALLELSQEADGADKFSLAEEESFIKVLTSIRSSRALRLLQHVDQLMPGSASKLLIFAEVAPLFAARRYAENVAMLGIPVLFL